MLVLTRKLQEQILIGNDVVITILQVRGQAVRVGIQAPRTVRVLRAELSSNDETVAEVTNSKCEEHAVTDQTVTIALNPQRPGAQIEIKPTNASRQPLAGRLQARRNPNPSSSTMPRQPERLPSTLLAAVGAS